MDLNRMWLCSRLVVITFLDLAALLGTSSLADDVKEGVSVAEESCSSGANAGGSTGAPDFFRSYGTAWVQAEMLQDEVRTNAFRDAILGNSELFKGKVVLDVGAGTGILSFFAAQAGAARVFAVEKSDMALIARQIAVDNGLNGTVEIIHGLLEEVVLPVTSVDIIISEWIGTFLIHESMLDSVLFARDRWLAPDGLLLPDHATLVIAGAEDQGSDLDSWRSFHGLDFSALAATSRKVAAQQCLFRNSLATEPAKLLELDLYRMSAQEQEFDIPIRLSSLGSVAHDVHALAAWFMLDFFSIDRPRCAGCPAAQRLQLSTHPDKPCTHWQQTLFSLVRPVTLPVGASLDILMRVRRAPWSQRDLTIQLTLDSAQPESAETFFIVGADL